MELTVDQKLKALFKLQILDTKLDQLRSVRGELPLEVSDLEDEITGLETRISNLNGELKDIEGNITKAKSKIKESQQFVKKYEGQLTNVKNNREYDALNKEIELQGLEMMAAEKRIKEYERAIGLKKEIIDASIAEMESRKQDLEFKNKELLEIVNETEIEEQNLLGERNEAQSKIEDRLIAAYDKIRNNYKNGIAVAGIVREACGGCFARIPPQRQADIRQHKKIIVCENCGRILVDGALAEEYAEKAIVQE